MQLCWKVKQVEGLVWASFLLGVSVEARIRGILLGQYFSRTVSGDLVNLSCSEWEIRCAMCVCAGLADIFLNCVRWVCLPYLQQLFLAFHLIPPVHDPKLYFRTLWMHQMLIMKTDPVIGWFYERFLTTWCARWLYAWQFHVVHSNCP